MKGKLFLVSVGLAAMLRDATARMILVSPPAMVK